MVNHPRSAAKETQARIRDEFGRMRAENRIKFANSLSFAVFRRNSTETLLSQRNAEYCYCRLSYLLKLSSRNALRFTVTTACAICERFLACLSRLINVRLTRRFYSYAISNDTRGLEYNLIIIYERTDVMLHQCHSNHSSLSLKEAILCETESKILFIAAVEKRVDTDNFYYRVCSIEIAKCTFPVQRINRK